MERYKDMQCRKIIVATLGIKFLRPKEIDELFVPPGKSFTLLTAMHDISSKICFVENVVTSKIFTAKF